MNLRPLNDRVLIRPHAAPTQTESGLQLVEHRKPEQSGTVVAVGLMRHPRKEEAEAFADAIAGGDKGEELQALLRDLVRREPCVKAGDEVLFSWQVGQEIFLHDDDQRYLLLREDDLLAVLED